jgi:hypothetical protein
MDTDLLNYPLGVTVLLKKTARVQDTITRESDGLVPLSPWSWTCLPVCSHTNGKELLLLPYTRGQERIQPLETLPL